MARPPNYLTPKVEEFRSIDLAWLRRKCAKIAGNAGRITWSRRNAGNASIGYAFVPEGIRLQYTYQGNDGAKVNVDELVAIVTTPTHFGGVRHWFACVSCRRRCRILYGGRHFRCRLCWGAKYESQYEAEPIRISNRRWRIRKLLEDRGGREWPFSLDDGFPPKPPRMQWRTYRSLRTLDNKLARRWVAFVRSYLDDIPF